MKNKLDYIILCNQRSGSHLIATLLNSHSEIACYGESKEKMKELINAKGKVKGKILMYNRAKEIPEGVKIIHLIRNPYDTARSRIVNSWKKFAPHHTEDVELNIKVPELEIKKVETHIKSLHNKFREKIKNNPHLELNYDEITGGKSIETLDEETTKKITDFLGVKYETLTTNLKRPKWNF